MRCGVQRRREEQMGRWQLGGGAWLALSVSSGSAWAVSFVEALSLAEQSPEVVMAQHGAAAAQAEQRAAGSLPDPKLTLELANWPVSGPQRGTLTADAMTQRSVGVIQALPHAAKRAAARQAAQAESAYALAKVNVARRQARREAALAWLEIYYAQRQQGVLDALAHEVDIARSAAVARGAAGEGVAAATAALQVAERRDAIEQRRRAAQAQLARWIGTAAAQPVSGEPPPQRRAPHPALEHHPELVALVPRAEQARAAWQQALAERRPDWEAGVTYHLRGAEFDDMVSLQIGVTLPLWAATRQIPRSTARGEDVARVEAERSALQREHEAELATLLATHETVTRRLDRLATVALPLVQQELSLALAAYEAGRGDLVAVSQARRGQLDLEWRRLEAERERAQIEARLAYFDNEAEP